jgi:aryl-alcohol dehydrogenase-like predicted oxidoreductase
MLPTTLLSGTGRTLPRLGFGGFTICRLPDVDQAVGVVEHAIDSGIRYFDTAPSYGNGTSEQRIGAALKKSSVKRSEFFIATKTLERSADGARRELEESLKRLQVEYVDSVQVHAVANDYETAFAENSVLKGLRRAKEEKLIRHIGFTCHANPKYALACLERFDFATALVPVNPIDTKHLSFTKDFLPAAVEKNIGVIAMKVFAGGSLLKNRKASAGELLRYALSQPGVRIVIPGCEKTEHIDEAVRAVKGFGQPLTAARRKAIEDKVGPHEGRASEWYKEPGDS